jgi:hypothetical protein
MRTNSPGMKTTIPSVSATAAPMNWPYAPVVKEKKMMEDKRKKGLRIRENQENWVLKSEIEKMNAKVTQSTEEQKATATDSYAPIVKSRLVKPAVKRPRRQQQLVKALPAAAAYY